VAVLNDYPLLSGTIRVPRVGAWTAEVEIRSDVSYVGSAAISLEGTNFVGASSRSSVKGPGRVACAVVGGAGGLETEVPARQYVGPNVSLVLGDILSLAGETISSAVSASLTGRSLTTWQRAAGTAKEALAQLAEALGVSWRVLLDGTVWLGAETWPEVTPECRVLDDDQATGTVTLSLVPSLLPGTTFCGQRIEQVRHELGTGEARTEASSTSPAAAMSAFLGPIEKRIRYSRSYSARVVKQNANGTMQILPDDPTFKGSGLDQVKIRLGVPGTVTVPKGARVELVFEDGDPQKPIATAFHDGSLTELSLGSGADFVALAQLVLDELNAIKTWADVHVHPTGMGPSGPPATPMTQPGSVAAAKVKAE
jgi:hypothetical protein